jgi:hypothetical protein
VGMLQLNWIPSILALHHMEVNGHGIPQNYR